MSFQSKRQKSITSVSGERIPPCAALSRDDSCSAKVFPFHLTAAYTLCRISQGLLVIDNHTLYGYNKGANKRNKGTTEPSPCPLNGFAVKWDLDPGDGYYDSRVVYFAVGK